MTGRGTVEVKRIYERRADDDGHRILVDRLWPRGLSRADAEIDEWCRDIAPSTELRKWFGHQAERRDEFRERYVLELDDAQHAQALEHLRGLAGGRLTLLTATKDLTLSHAPLLAERLA